MDDSRSRRLHDKAKQSLGQAATRLSLCLQDVAAARLEVDRLAASVEALGTSIVEGGIVCTGPAWMHVLQGHRRDELRREHMDTVRLSTAARAEFERIQAAVDDARAELALAAVRCETVKNCGKA